jgi:hypothetical protein
MTTHDDPELESEDIEQPEDPQGTTNLVGWGRMPNEPESSHSKFVYFRDLGADRSMRKVAEHFNLTFQTIKQAAVRWSWRERVLLYDHYIAKQEADARLAATADMTRTWAQRRQEQREHEYKLAGELTRRAMEMLQQPLFIEEYEIQEDGETIIKRVIPARWTMKDAALYAETASKLARTAMELENGSNDAGVLGDQLATVKDEMERKILDYVAREKHS